MNSVRLKELLEAVPSLKIQGSTNHDILLITSDSRKVMAGSMFVAVKGTHRDGHDFIYEAFRAGAQVCVVENPAKIPKDITGTFVIVENSREFLDQALSYFYDDPSKDLICIGVTGTNGKTTITHLVEILLNAQNLPTAVMGTIDNHLLGQTFSTEMTTPGPELLQKRLYEFREANAKAVAMEVSSHALDQRRVDSVKFDIAIFTNLTRDHLDYHKSMQEYFNSKEKLFSELLWKSPKFDRFAIINGDDFYGRWIKADPTAKTLYYGVKEADFLISPVSQTFDGVKFTIEIGSRKFDIKSRMIGQHNIYNLTAAFAVGACLGLNLDQCVKTLEPFAGVRGRLERIDNLRGIHVFVDYAHTDDALKNVLESLKQIRDQSESHAQAKIITVFGCGGDRDRGKRPIMAKTAEIYSDQVIVTSDNPRTEVPREIINEILSGFSESYLSSSVRNEVDREKGIALALKSAQVGDVVLIAGKGHEDYQIIGKNKIHFNDVEVVRKLI